MKITSIFSNLFFSLSLLFFLGLTITAATYPTSRDADLPPRWERLGKKKVNHKLDRDELFITGREGRFTKLKFEVSGSALNMHRCVIHFANGSTEEVNIRHNFTQGSGSRVIDLPGNKRVIKKIVFWYDSQNMVTGKATLTVWGRR